MLHGGVCHITPTRTATEAQVAEEAPWFKPPLSVSFWGLAMQGAPVLVSPVTSLSRGNLQVRNLDFSLDSGQAGGPSL